MKIKFLFFVFLSLTACKPGHKQSFAPEIIFPDSAVTVDSISGTKLLNLKPAENDSLSGDDLDENLFGKFYGDRAAFYIIKNPGYKIFGENIKSITLFYLDGNLFKTKYIMENNITDRLINKYPRFSFRGFDERNRELMGVEKIFYKEDKKWFLNKHLTNYDIHWLIGNYEMRMRVNERDSLETYIYIVKNKIYERTFSEIERSE